MSDKWKDQFRTLLATILGRVAPSHGYSLHAIETAEARLSVKLPEPLRDYYLTVGRHKINQVHNRLLHPANLFLSAGRLVFMEENQWVLYWGVRSRSEAADPVVFQTADPDDEDWLPEGRCSSFLQAMLCWQACAGGIAHLGYSERVAPKTVRTIKNQWQLVGRMYEMSAFVQKGRVACVFNSGGQELVHIGARNRRDFRAIESELEVAFHEA